MACALHIYGLMEVSNMKKLILISILALGVISVIGCGKNTDGLGALIQADNQSTNADSKDFVMESQDPDLIQVAVFQGSGEVLKFTDISKK